MSWIIAAGRRLNLGEAAGHVFLDFFQRLSDRTLIDDLPLREALIHTIHSADPGSELRGLADQLLQRFDQPALKDLLKTVGDIERRDQAELRALAWPKLDWARETSLHDALLLNLDTEAGARLVFLQNDTPRGPGLPAIAGAAAARLEFNGEIASELKGEGLLDAWVITANAKGGARRRAFYHFDCNSEATLVGAALAKAVTRVAVPYDYDALDKAFEPAGDVELVAIELEGAQNLDAAARIAVSIPTIEAGVPGTVGVRLGGAFATGRSFRFVITKELDRGLVIRLTSAKESRRGVDLGASYKLGLSDLPPGAAGRLLKEGSRAAEFLEKIDARLDDAATWIRPGSLIRDRIEEWVREALPQAADAGEETDPSRRLLRSLMAMLGGDKTEALSDRLIETITSQTADIIAEVVDDALGVVAGDGSDLSRRFAEAVSGRLSETAKGVLDDSVISRIIPAIRERVEALAGDLDDEAKQALTELLGREPEDLVRQVRETVEDARSLLAKVLEGIQASVEELLAIEVAYARMANRDLACEFDVGFPRSASDAFRAAVLGPSRFTGQLLEDQRPPGIDLRHVGRQTSLERSRSLDWGISFATVRFAGGRALSTDIERIETHDGVRVLTKAEYSRDREFWDEARELSFVSANSLYQLRQPEALEAATGQEVAEDVFEIDLGRTQPPRFSLTLTERDGSLRDHEIPKLLQRFVDARVIDEGLEDQVRVLVEEARHATSDRTPVAAFSLGLAIPPDQIGRLFAHHAGNEPHVVAVTSRALVVADAESINAALPAGRQDAIRAVAARSMMSASPAAFEARAQALSVDSDTRASFIMANLDELISETAVPLTAEFGAMAQARDTAKALKHLKDATRALEKTLIAGHELITASVTLDDEALLERQKRLVEHIKPFLKPGTPSPFRIGGKASFRLVALYRALQDLAFEALAVRPPVIFRFQPQTGRAATLVAGVPDVDT